MNNTIKKSNITYIPTELNAFTYLKYHQKKQSKTLSSYCMWLVALLIWNLLITGFLILDRVEHLTPELEVIQNYELLED